MTVLKNVLTELGASGEAVYVPEPIMKGLPLESTWRLTPGPDPAKVVLVGLGSADQVNDSIGQLSSALGSGLGVIVVDRALEELPTGRLLSALAEHELVVVRLAELTNARVGVGIVVTQDLASVPISHAFGEPIDFEVAGVRLRNEWLIEGFAARGGALWATALNKARESQIRDQERAAAQIAEMEADLARLRREAAVLRTRLEQSQQRQAATVGARARRVSTQAKTDPAGAARSVAQALMRRVRG